MYLYQSGKLLMMKAVKKFLMSKLEDPIGFIKWLLHQAISHQQVEGCSEEMYEKEGFYRKESRESY